MKKNECLRQIKVYPLTDHGFVSSGKSLVFQITRVIKGGAKMVQIRDKESSMGIMVHETEKIRKITRQKNVILIVNDRIDLAAISEADGVHLGQDDLPVEKARDILGNKAIIGISTHSVEQVKIALKTSADYIAFGPVYPTATKTDTEPVTGLKLLRRISKIVDRPLFAIGGINISRFPEVLKNGATGAAVISDIFRFPDPGKRIKKYLELV